MAVGGVLEDQIDGGGAIWRSRWILTWYMVGVCV